MRAKSGQVMVPTKERWKQKWKGLKLPSFSHHAPTSFAMGVYVNIIIHV